MATLVMGAAPAAPTRFRHASGETAEGCLACADEAGICCDGCMGREPGPWCLVAEDDPDEPGVCRWCSHTAEPVPAQDSLLCPDCENASCRCAA